MRTISANESAWYGATRTAGGRTARARVIVDGKDLSTYPEDDFVLGVTLNENVDSIGLSATVNLRKSIGDRSLSPLHGTSPLNRDWNPSNSLAELLTLGASVSIVVDLLPIGAGDEVLAPVSTMTIFEGFIDSIDFAGTEVVLDCAGKEARLRDTWIESERIYAYLQGAYALAGARIFELRLFTLGELVVPSEENVNGHFYEVTTSTYSCTAEPAWPTAGGGTVSQDSTVFTERGAVSTTAGTAVETVMQQIMDDNVTAADTIVVPTSPNWSVKWFLQQRESVLDAVRKLAEQIGWCFRYKWHTATSSFKPHLYDPNRTTTVVRHTIEQTDQLKVSRLSQSIAGIRNAIRVIYSDSGDRDAQGTPKRKTVTATDTNSIAAYGRRFMEVAEGDSSNIDTSSEANRMAGAIMSDLATPNAEIEVETFFAPHVEVCDLVRLAANPAEGFTDNQLLGVVAIAHSIDGDGARTTFTLRGKPASGYGRHLARAGEAKPEDVHQLQALQDGGQKTVTIDPTVGGSRIRVDRTKQISKLGAAVEVHVGSTSDFAPSSTTLRRVSQGDGDEIGSLWPGETYYLKTVPFARNASRIVRGLPSVAHEFVAGQAKASHYGTGALPSHVPLNGNFEDATRDIADAPPDQWFLGAGEEWSSTGSLWHDTHSLHGRVLVLRQHALLKGVITSAPFPVRNGLPSSSVRLYHRRRLGSDTTYDLLVKLRGYTDHTLATLTGTQTLTISGLAATHAIDTWKQTSHAWNGFDYGTNFATISFERETASNAYAYDIGEIYFIEEEFHTPVATLFRGKHEADAWSVVSLLNSWVDYDSVNNEVASYRMLNLCTSPDNAEMIALRGMVKDGTVTSPIFNLPADHRPAKKVTMAVITNTGVGKLEITTGGDVILQTGGNGWVSLSGVVFSAA